MTKYFPPAQKKPKAKPCSPSSSTELSLNASTPALWDSLKQCASVNFGLNAGNNLHAQIQGLEEDNGVIYGVTVEGLNFAIPYASVAFVMEMPA